jgi:hypothetical protein
MIQFVAFSLVKMAELLKECEKNAVAACAIGKSDELIPEFSQGQARAVIEFCHVNCAELSLGYALHRIEFIASELRQPMSWGRLKMQIEVLKQAIDHELRYRRFAFVPVAKATILDHVQIDWSTVWAKFPSSEKDARWATEAYALGLNAASVYHMMMVLEIGLDALAGTFKVKYERRNWANIIQDIENEIVAASTSGRTPAGSKPPTPSVAARRRDDLTLFATVAKEFTYFREAWRNHAAHGRADYDENDALKVLTRASS